MSTPQLTPAMAMLYKPKGPTEVCMVYLVALHLKESVNEEAALLFLSTPMISSITGFNINAQRMVINRFFTKVLMHFRANHEVPVNDIVMMLPNDGLLEDWTTLFTNIVAPFLKEHNVFHSVFTGK